jgi:uncharacterized protein
MSIRIFDSIRSTASGGPSGTEWLGLDRADLVVVETDGTWEQVDSLKIAFEGAPVTGYNVFEHAVDEVSTLPDLVRRQRGLDGLAAQCQTCPVVRQCGGGLFAHRYREGNGFDNPSVYCADLQELIVSLNRRARDQAASGPADDGVDLRVPVDLLDRIGGGQTDAAAVGALADAQLSIGRALLVAIAEGGSPAVRDGWELLTRLDQEAPETVAATLAHPYVRVWAIDALRRRPLDPAASAYLSCVAAAAAINAGVDAQLDVPIRAGALHLPSLGTAILDDSASGTARLRVDGRAFTLRVGPHAMHVPLAERRPEAATVGGRWLPNRILHPGAAPVLCEDLDPYRDCHDWKAAERLDDAAAVRWAGSMRAAWEVMRSDAPDHLVAIDAGLRALVPLADDPTGMLRSSTARQAFGSVAVGRTDERALAVMIVHEFQHNILGALLDVCDLFDAAHETRLTVGWRSDPRPVEGVLQGTYAHLAITGIWGHRAQRPGASAVEQGHYERYRAWTSAAIDALTGSGALTAAGQRFVAAMAGALAGRPA